MTTIIYLRTSTEEQNPENQEKDCRTLTKEVPEVFEEKQSAWSDKKDRTIFESIKKRISNKEVTDLIVWDLDRLFRNRKKLVEFFSFCLIYKCHIHSFRQQWLESLNNIPEPFNEIMSNLMLQVIGWIAEEESNKKSERVKNAVRREDGEPTKSYKGNKWGRKALKLDEEILKLHSEGKKFREIASQVFYWDKNGHKKYVSLGYVHKLITKFKGENNL